MAPDVVALGVVAEEAPDEVASDGAAGWVVWGTDFGPSSGSRLPR